MKIMKVDIAYAEDRQAYFDAVSKISNLELTEFIKGEKLENGSYLIYYTNLAHNFI